MGGRFVGCCAAMAAHPSEPAVSGLAPRRVGAPRDVSRERVSIVSPLPPQTVGAGVVQEGVAISAPDWIRHRASEASDLARFWSRPRRRLGAAAESRSEA